MAVVSPIPVAIALLLGIGLFVAATWWLVQESRRPVDWAHVDARVARDLAHRAPHVSHTRTAAVCVVFTLWSLWATARPVSGWR